MTDFGAQVTRKGDGRLLIPPSVAVDERTDPDSPNRTVIGARREDPLLRILRLAHGHDPRRWPPDVARQWRAAEWLRDDVALSQGARVVADAMPAMRSGTPCYGYSDARLDAIGRLRSALAVLDPVMVMIVQHVVVSLMPIRRLPGVTSRQRVAATGVMLAGLTLLADHYENSGR